MLLLLHIVFSIGSIVWIIAGRLDLWISLFHRFLEHLTFVYLARAFPRFRIPRTSASIDMDRFYEHRGN